MNPATPYHSNPDNDPRGPYVLADITGPGDRPKRIYEWQGHLPPTGRSWRYTVERMRELAADGRIVVTRTGMPRMKRFLSEARPRDQAPEEPHQEPAADETDDEPTAGRLDFVIRTAMREAAELVARNPSLLQQVEWRDLERVLREVFEGLGFTTRLTRPGKDGGFDLELRCLEDGVEQVFLVEVKHWVEGSKRPGADVVSAFFDIVARAGQDTGGVLLSTSGFTRQVRSGRTEVEQQRVRLGGTEKIVSLCQSYLASAAGLWVPMTSLPDLLLEGTF